MKQDRQGGLNGQSTVPSEQVHAQMSRYEHREWQALVAHWERRRRRRPVHRIGARLSQGTQRTAGMVAMAVPDAMGKPVARLAGTVANHAVVPVLEQVGHLVEVANEWMVDLNNPAGVERLMSQRQVGLDSFRDLQQLDLQVCDALNQGLTARAASVGVIEGAAMGALSLVPFGPMAAIPMDLLLVQALSASVATRTAYGYGFDAAADSERNFITHLLRRSFIEQAGKAVPMRDTARAWWAIEGRTKWSEKLLSDHRLLAALKVTAEQLGPKGATAPVAQVSKFVPLVGMAVSAGGSAAVLTQVAKDSRRFCRTRFLCEKYDMPLPAWLVRWDEPDLEAYIAPGDE